MSYDQTDGILIAETGETGEVTWVWVLKNGDRFARPLRRRDVALALDRFNFTGAPRDDIASWLGNAVPA